MDFEYYNRDELLELTIKSFEIIEELKIYLMSEKFHKDTTVQVQDVLNRLELK